MLEGRVGEFALPPTGALVNLSLSEEVNRMRITARRIAPIGVTGILGDLIGAFVVALWMLTHPHIMLH
jgi:hypothetical protein